MAVLRTDGQHSCHCGSRSFPPACWRSVASSKPVELSGDISAMQPLPAPPLQPATQTCCYCNRELPLVSRVISPPNPRVNAGTQSRCIICWLLEDVDRAWTEEFGHVPREVMDKFSELLATALDEIRTFRAAPLGWAAAAETRIEQLEKYMAELRMQVQVQGDIIEKLQLQLERRFSSQTS
ncbi:hypothetical protein N9L68_06065 [bacterium]|nr:hypothetical protein [bacterium]